ncbi:MAG: leucine-rich repeat protein, partial [Clostridia bacterium]|nr:leucine-rich repeat protein [Clostridia bacterium]
MEANEWVIGASAFQKNALTTVDLSNVVYVGGNAFNSNSLTSVKFNEDIWLIANAAFGKNALTSIEFPETTTHALNMDNMAFAINSLTTVKIPNNTEKLHKWVFLQNTGVETVPASGTTAEKKGGVVYMYT